MKKIFICITTVLLLFGLIGCNKTDVVDSEGTEEENAVDKIDSTETNETEESMEEEPDINEVVVDEVVVEEINPILKYEYDVRDYSDDDLPHRYRTVYKELKKPDEKYVMDSSYTPSTKGLSSLKMSGSAEFSEEQLETLSNDLKSLTSGPIYIVDLRQENHLFLDGESIYWNGTNIGLNSDEVLDAEYELKEELSVLLSNRDIKTEEELVNEYGLNYIRLAAQDNVFPSCEVVEEFLTIIKKLPSNAWLHFHCKEGKGRTTTFMAMFDIYKNVNVSLKDIAYRQYGLDGIYVLYDGSRLSSDDPEKEIWEEREYYMYLYYDYIHRNVLKKGYTWKDWLEEFD